MPRQARLDAPGLLQHIIARGIERREIFKDAKDRKSFLDPRFSTAPEIFAAQGKAFSRVGRVKDVNLGGQQCDAPGNPLRHASKLLN